MAYLSLSPAPNVLSGKLIWNRIIHPLCAGIRWATRISEPGCLVLCTLLLSFPFFCSPCPAVASTPIKKVVIAYNKSNPPLKFQDGSGNPSGILIDLWKLWSKKVGVAVEFREAPFQETLEMVKSGRADIHAGIFYTRARDAVFDFSQPVLDINYYIFHREGLPRLDSIEQLLPFRIGVPRGYTETFVREHLPGASLVVYENFPDLYRGAMAGEVMVFLSPSLNFNYYLQKSRQRNPFRYNPARPVYRRVYRGAVAEGNRELLRLVDRGLAGISLEERVAIERSRLGRSGGDGSRERVIIACDSDFAPFTMLNVRGEPAGLLVDLWKDWGKREDVHVDFLFDDREGSISAVKEGLADFHSGLQPDSPWMLASKPFYQLDATVFVPTDKKIHSLLELRGLQVGVLERVMGERLEKYLPTPHHIVRVRNYSELFSGLGRGELSAFVDKDIVVKSLLSRQGRQGEFRRLPDFTTTVSLAAVTTQEKEHLLERINHGLDGIPFGDYIALEDKWLKKPESGYYHVKANQSVALHKRSGEPVASSRQPVLNSEEKQFLVEHPVIRMGYDPEFFPFEFRGKNGAYSGMVSDYVRILQERLGLKLDITQGKSWKEVMQDMKQGRLDMVPCIGKTRERERYLLYSRPYISFQRVVIARSDFPFISNLGDLRSYRVAVQADTSHVGFLHEHTHVIPIEYPTLQDALLAVSRKEADAFIGNLASTTFWIRKLHLTNLKIAAPAQQEKQELYFGVRKDWPLLVSIINKGLASITTEEENAIYRRWVSVEYEPGLSPGLFRDYLLKTGGVFLACLLGFLLWNYRLKREVAQRKEAEEKLKQYAGELEMANRHLQSLDRLKSMFIASMSHELRTPLNSIIGFTGVILQGMAGEINERQRDQLSRVYRSAKHLLSLISDVIDISKIEAGRIDVFPSEFRLTDVVDEALENIQPQLELKDLSLSVSVPGTMTLVTDRKRVLQVLINFLSNSVKFTEEGGITVAARARNGQVRITVTDTGIGIKKKDMSHLFEAFERLDSHLRVKAGGTGLGLYLTRKIVVELLGGEIEVESVPGQGSSFSVLIPRKLEIEEKDGEANAGSGD